MIDLAWFVPIGLVVVGVVWVSGLSAYRAVAGEPNDATSAAGGSKRNKSSKTKKHIATQSKRRRNE